jgi:hypothetical protein
MLFLPVERKIYMLPTPMRAVGLGFLLHAAGKKQFRGDPSRRPTRGRVGGSQGSPARCCSGSAQPQRGMCPFSGCCELVIRTRSFNFPAMGKKSTGGKKSKHFFSTHPTLLIYKKTPYIHVFLRHDKQLLFLRSLIYQKIHVVLSSRSINATSGNL